VELRERVARLTRRQKECLYLVHEGLSGKSIAAALAISPNVVKEHLEASRNVLGVDKSLRAARLMVSVLGLPHSVGGIELGVDAVVPIAPPALSSADPADDTLPPETMSLHEPSAVYRPPIEAARVSFLWPWRTRGRDHNDVGPIWKLVQILLCAFALGALAFVLWGLIHGTKQVITEALI
jgi:DNA-binding CsgD family transcriptional regulator